MSILPSRRLSLWVLGLWLVGRGLLAQPRQEFSRPGGALQGEADRIEADPRGILLEGGALLDLQVGRSGTLPAGHYQVRADRLGVDWEARQVEASGQVSLQTPQGEIPTARRIQLDLRGHRGYLEEVHLFYPDTQGAIFSPRPEDLLAPEEIPTGLWFYAQKADYSPTHLSLYSASLAPATRTPPPYSLRADFVSLQGPRWFEVGQAERLNWSAMRLQMRQVSGYWGKRKLFTLPAWTLSGARAERELFWLNLGYDPVEGLYTRIREGASWGRDWRGDLNLRLGTKNGLTGLASLSREAGEGLFRVSLARREQVPGRIRSEARVSRWPEASYTWTPEPGATAGRRPFSLQLSVGKYEDLQEHRRTERSHLAVTVQQAAPRWGRATGTWGGRFSQSWYGTGDRFSVLSAWAGIDLCWEARAFARALYRTHHRHGRTPLPSLDEVDIPHELQITVNALVDRPWFVGLEGRYDLSRRDFEAIEYTVARRRHLLQYGLTWRCQPDTRFHLHLRVLGF